MPIRPAHLLPPLCSVAATENQIGAGSGKGFFRSLLKDLPLGPSRDAVLGAIETFTHKHNEAMVQQLSAKFRSSFSALALSENFSPTLMWSHYSSSHHGFCIEYDFSALSPGDLRRRLCFPVFYTRKRRDATRYIARSTAAGFNNLFGELMCLMKDADWAYEREWRIIHAIGPTYANSELSMPNPNSIILGYQVAGKDEAWMLAFCKARSIPLKKMLAQPNSYDLKPTTVWTP